MADEDVPAPMLSVAEQKALCARALKAVARGGGLAEQGETLKSEHWTQKARIGVVHAELVKELVRLRVLTVIDTDRMECVTKCCSNIPRPCYAITHFGHPSHYPKLAQFVSPVTLNAVKSACEATRAALARLEGVSEEVPAKRTRAMRKAKAAPPPVAEPVPKFLKSVEQLRDTYMKEAHSLLAAVDHAFQTVSHGDLTPEAATKLLEDTIGTMTSRLTLGRDVLDKLKILLAEWRAASIGTGIFSSLVTSMLASAQVGPDAADLRPTDIHTGTAGYCVEEGVRKMTYTLF